MPSSVDTIFALATAPIAAGVAVVRLSGPDCDDILRKLGVAEALKPRYLSLQRLTLRDVLLDECLVVRFEKGRSYTGEALAELQIHGGRATIEAVLAALSEVGGRPAEPGEFTRRALENNRMDLVQVEALADLIDAETEMQRLQASSLLEGSLSKDVRGWRDAILECLSLTEASIDFADEEDAPVDISSEVRNLIERLSDEIAAVLAGGEGAERIREGFTVALIGPPNVGKSSLINRIANREVSLVSPFPGTTRDVMEAHCQVDGLPVSFLDLAGIRDSADPVEKMGVARALDCARTADLRVFLRSGDTPELGEADLFQNGDLRISTKVDALPKTEELGVSSVTGEGIDELVSRIGSTLLPDRKASRSVARQRQKENLSLAKSFLDAARSRTEAELLSIELREAAKALDMLVGEINADDVLDGVFSRFCMGK